MKKYAGLLAVLLILPLSPLALADDDDDRLVFRAELRGANEVPHPVETNTRGRAVFKVNEKETRIRFTLDIKKARKILGRAGAHIHCGFDDENGPVVAFLAAELPGGFNGRVKIKAALNKHNIVNDACGATIRELVHSMLEGRTYVNVHSIANPSGEIRGQIMLEDDDDDYYDDDDDDDDE